MTPLEAMTFLIKQVDDQMSATRQLSEITQMQPEEQAHCEEVELAISVITAMLNTALPIARFRCFVSVDKHSLLKSRVHEEFTVCAVNIAGIKGGLIGLNEHRTDVHVTLWEQRATGAEMLSGYQGPTKGKRYRNWLDSLNVLEAPTTTVQ